MSFNLIDIRKRLPAYTQQAETYQAGQTIRQRELMALARYYAAKTDELHTCVKRLPGSVFWVFLCKSLTLVAFP